MQTDPLQQSYKIVLPYKQNIFSRFFFFFFFTVFFLGGGGGGGGYQTERS